MGIKEQSRAEKAAVCMGDDNIIQGLRTILCYNFVALDNNGVFPLGICTKELLCTMEVETQTFVYFKSLTVAAYKRVFPEQH